VLRDPRVTSALIGARTVDQLNDSLDALRAMRFSADELREIDRFAQEGNIDL
jgi:L-glyceraldehyde 3-phosphate reductase